MVRAKRNKPWNTIRKSPCSRVRKYRLPSFGPKCLPSSILLLQMKKNKSGHNPYAVSFPEYRETGLGEKIRVFAEAQELERLNLSKVLGRLFDYVHCTSIRKVPERKLRGYAVYSRYQPEGSIWVKARRYAKRHPGVTIEEAARLLQRKEKICQTAVHTDEKPFPRRNI